jgi:predicted nucleotidyltransferase
MLQEKSYGSVKLISINRPLLLEELKQISRQICAEHPEVKGVHLFGSLARADQVGTSDIDLLILLKGVFREDPIEEALNFRPYFTLPIGVDLLVIGEVELAERLAENDPFFTKIWQEQISLIEP